MCGLLGLVIKSSSGANNMEMNCFRDLLYMDALRGMDSTGVASFHSNGDMRGLKEATSALDFMTEKKYSDWEKECLKNGKAMLGHNRKRTVGKTSDATAHPFPLHDGRYLFMHNGTLRNHEKIAKTEVDSEALGLLLTECEGDKEKLEAALAQVEGAYACLWIDQEKEVMYMLRNDERPMYIGETAMGHVVFSSEFGFAVSAFHRNHLSLAKCEMTEPNTLYSIKLDGFAVNVEKEKLTVKKATPLLGTTSKEGKATGVKSSVTFQGGEVSKNSFKRIRRTFLGKSFTFFLADYLPRFADDAGKGDEWLVWGENEALEFEHMVKGRIKGFDEQTLLSFEDIPLTGKIEEILYDPASKGVIFEMANVWPVMGSMH